jgi:hypothetical protein
MKYLTCAKSPKIGDRKRDSIENTTPFAIADFRLIWRGEMLRVIVGQILRVKGCGGSICLREITSIILHHTYYMPSNGEERNRMLALRERVENLHTDAERLVQKSNWFTWFLARLFPFIGLEF